MQKPKPVDTTKASLATSSVRVYLVGGAVRDHLLGQPVVERDWVVVGATPEYMTTRGFISVGHHFPVFLHPTTREQYALARTERKTGPGHTGFACHFSPDVTLEEDLKRRDFTINAIAQDDKGHIIDLYRGQDDLSHKILRHVSEAFTEDPLRILRAARFLAQLSFFQLHANTEALIQKMVQDHCLQELPGERVIAEINRALTFEHTQPFWEMLEHSGALNILLPGFDLNLQTKSLMQRCQSLTQTSDQRALIRLSVMLSTLEQQEHRQNIYGTYRLSKQHRAFAELIHHHHQRWRALPTAHAREILDFLKIHDAFRRPQRFNLLLQAYSAFDSYPLSIIKKPLEAALQVRVKSQSEEPTKVIAHLLDEARLKAIKSVM